PESRRWHMPSGTTWIVRLGSTVTHIGTGRGQRWAVGFTVEWADMTWLKGRDGGARPPSRR
ncbi:MAG: hypothetical protein M3490_02780, partial [Chloroflexota bacterium]|nr:hypothetical protein [Chloroflexota bacterium]